MSKKSLRKEAEACHKLAAAFTIALDAVNEFMPKSPVAEKIRLTTEEVVPLMEALLSEIYKIPELSSGTYLNGLTNKIDTVVRKNFERITGEKPEENAV